MEKAHFKQHVMRAVLDWKTYTVGRIRTLACLLDARFMAQAVQPNGHEALQRCAVLEYLARAHGVKLPFRAHRV